MKRITIEDIDNFPEKIDQNVLNSLFDQIVKMDDVSFFQLDLEILAELSNRQWNRYEILDLSIRNRLEGFIEKHWNKSSLDQTELIISIVVQLGLSELYSNTMENISDFSLEIQNEWKNLEDEIKGEIGNPYSAM